MIKTQKKTQRTTFKESAKGKPLALNARAQVAISGALRHVHSASGPAFFGASEVGPALYGGFEAVDGAQRQIADFPFGHGQCDGVEQPSVGRGGVEFLPDGFKPHLARAQRLFRFLYVATIVTRVVK